MTAFGVWVGTLLIGIGGSSLLDSWCPPDLMISGVCTAPWYRPAMAVLEMMCAGIAAAGFIALPVKVAPAFHVYVGVACFIVGGLLTVELAMAGDLWAPAAIAGIVGVVTLGAIISSARRRFERREGEESRPFP